MTGQPKTFPAELDFERLEARVEGLVRMVGRLREENLSLRRRQEELVGERAALIEKNELARNRVEAMISRLKAMEQG